MIEEHKIAVSALIQKNLAECPYSLNEVAMLSGFQRPEVLEGVLRGDFRVPLDKVLPLAKALGCDEKLLFKLVMNSWFGVDFVKTIEDVFGGNVLSVAENGWIDFLREFHSENVPELTTQMRRRLRLLLKLPG
ncbi:hypothetical protein HPDFL43_21809 [Hoeflea phototrophica DFL-43]|uniref:HTH cro/C1-type domain-containing protein n=1 Tax=Hoeflea phototrophica (strain DSM 17068 / NCIMB 14078 / DFL-43) TaxID=411684 RepID=A9DFL9_HOEPD|nr:hypothetical protein [Hoeflea phototrophica]EDQ31791.1 hypothetical protein HPDFL43_21809 [Hoeflea phototrophica DFL-43]